MPGGLIVVIMYGIRQTPSRAVLDPTLACSTSKSNSPAFTSKRFTLESMGGNVHVVLRSPRSSKVNKVARRERIAAPSLFHQQTGSGRMLFERSFCSKSSVAFRASTRGARATGM